MRIAATLIELRQAGGKVTLAADNQVNLLAAQDTAIQQSSNQSSSNAVGATFAVGGNQNGLSFQASANKALVSAAKAKINSDYQSVTEQSGLKAGDVVCQSTSQNLPRHSLTHFDAIHPRRQNATRIPCAFACGVQAKERWALQCVVFAGDA